MANNNENNIAKQLEDYINLIRALPDEAANDDAMQMVKETLMEKMAVVTSSDAIHAAYAETRANGISKQEYEKMRKDAVDYLEKTLKSLEFKNENKIMLVRIVFDAITELYNRVIGMYDNYYETLYFEKTHENAQLPTYAHADDACCDIYAPEDIDVPANARGFAVGVGLKPVIPNGYELLIRPRSGMSMKTCMRISNCVATIDSGYTGEIRILFDNHSDEPYHIKAGDRIAQFALKPVYRFYSKFTDDAAAMKQTTRGGKGFGSTDK